MRRLWLCAVLAFAATNALAIPPTIAGSGGWKADYYVSTAGNDTTGDGSKGNPYLTISKALSMCGTGGKTIAVDDGTYVESTGGAGYLNMTTAYTTTVTIRALRGPGRVTITGSAAGYTVLMDGAQRVTFRDVTIQASAATSQAVYMRLNTQNISFIRCTLIGYGGSSTVRLRPWGGTYTIGPLSFIGCTFTSTGAGNVTAIYTQMANAGEIITGVTVTGSTFNVTGSAISLIGTTGATVTSNSITCSGAGVCVGIGGDASTTYATSGSTVAGNTITCAASHALLIGQLSDTTTVTGNTVYGGDYALVVKNATSATITTSTFSGGTAASVFFKGSAGNSMTGCTITNSGATAKAILSDVNGAVKSGANTITGNTITVSGGADVWNFPQAGNDVGAVVNGNAYSVSGVGSDYGTIWGTAGVATLANARTAWSAYTPNDNDTTSTGSP